MKSVRRRSDADKGWRKESILMTTRTERDEDTQKDKRVALRANPGKNYREWKGN